MSEYRYSTVKRTYRPAVPANPRDPDGEIVKQAIAMAVEEKRAKIAAESQRQSNIRKLWSQLSGVPEDQVLK